MKKRKTLLDVLRPKKATWSVDYAITITLNPKLYSLTAEDQLKQIQNWRYLFTTHCICTFVYEFTDKMNIHIHGICKVSTMVKRHPLIYLTDQIKSFSKFGRQYCVKQIDNMPKWVEYLSKDLERTSEFGIYPIEIDQYKAIKFREALASEKNQSPRVCFDNFIEEDSLESEEDEISQHHE